MKLMKESVGNMRIAVIVDSSAYNDYKYTEQTVYAVLEHLGIPFTTVDLAETSVSRDQFANISAVVIAQDNVGQRISTQLAEQITVALGSGVGLVNFDSNLSAFWPNFKKMWCSSFRSTSTSEIRKTDLPHFITCSQEKGKSKCCKKPISTCKVSNLAPSVQVLLENQESDPLLIIKQDSQCRMVQFVVSPRIWLREYFGHAEGLDDIFWKSIVWAARKPFMMKAMPPFVTMRVDDCCGWENFKWIEIANKHGYIPNVGLFTECISKSDVTSMKQFFEKNMAEFSPHAYAGDPDRSLIYYQHNKQEYSEEELSLRFQKLDEQFDGWGIRMSSVLNPHFEEVGKNTMPFLRARKILYRMQTFLPGELWLTEHNDWKPKPYGHHGLSIDYLPGYPDFMVVSANNIPCRMLRMNRDGTYTYKSPLETLSETDLFWKAMQSISIDFEEAVVRGSMQIKNGLDNMFFGVLVFHEYLLKYGISLSQFDWVLEQIEKNTSGYHKIYKSYEYIAEYARCKMETHLEQASYDDKKKQITCSLRGSATVPIMLYVFEEEAGQIKYNLKEVPPFCGKSPLIRFDI
jgi:hypothetical protein